MLSAELWESIEGDAGQLRAVACWGIDLGTIGGNERLSRRTGQTTGRLESLAAFPDTPSIAERGLRDGVGRLYVDMERRGELVTTAGRVVDVELLLREAVNRFGPPDCVTADRWREGELKDALDTAGVPAGAFVSRGQGFYHGGEDVRTFRRECLTGNVTPTKSLLLRAAMREAVTVSDPAGNSKLAKSSEGGRRSRARDDAAAAAILAVSVGSRGPEPQEDSGPSYAMVS